MARSVRPELIMADYECRAFVRSQYADALRLGYPKCAAFAKDIARGTVAPTPIEDDPMKEAVGAFFFGRLNEIQRRVIADKYIGLGTDYERSRRLGMTVHRRRHMIDSILTRLTGWLERGMAAPPSTAMARAA